MKIILATGGSGGHIFPALKTAQRLKSLGHDVVMMGALQFAEERLKAAGISYKMLAVEGFNAKSPLAVCSFSLRMVKSIATCIGFQRSFQPQIVAGFGSYSSFPVVFASSLLNIPTLTHEQNVIPGKANRLSFRFSRRVAVTFPSTQQYVSKREVVCTGCPCNSDRSPLDKSELLAKFNLQCNRQTILVLGGSQGSRYLNEVFFEAIPYLQAECDLQVIHMTGRTDYSLYAEKYRHLNIPYHVCSFIEDIQAAYSAADVVLARAGAGTVCELAAFRLPSILVPYPFAHGHQTANAKVLEDAGAAIIVEQRNLNRVTLIEALSRIQEKRVAWELVERRLDEIFPANPTERLVEAITSLKS